MICICCQKICSNWIDTQWRTIIYWVISSNPYFLYILLIVIVYILNTNTNEQYVYFYFISYSEFSIEVEQSFNHTFQGRRHDSIATKLKQFFIEWISAWLSALIHYHNYFKKLWTVQTARYLTNLQMSTINEIVEFKRFNNI